MGRQVKIFLVAGALGITLCKLALDLASPGAWFWIFTCAYLGLAILALRLYMAREGGLDVFSPILPSLTLLYLYAASSALNTEVTGTTIFQDPISLNVLKTYYLACTLGVIGLGTGFLIQGTSSPNESRPQGPSDRTLRELLLLIVPVLALVCLPWMKEAFDFIHVKPYTETALAGRLAKQAMGEMQPMVEVFLIQLPSVLLMAVATCFLFRARWGVIKALGGVVLFANLATSALGGQRGGVALAGTVLLVFYHYRVHRLGMKGLFAIFIGGFLMTSTLSFVRSTNDFGEMLKLLTEAMKGGNTTFLAFQNSTEFAVGQNLMRLIAGIHDGQTNFTWGGSVVSELLVFIPRSVFPGRPLPLGEQFVVVFYPGVREMGGGYGFFNLMEGYWAFGLVGVFGFMAIYACIVDRIYRTFLKGGMSDFKALWYGNVLYASVFMAVRSGILGVFKAVLINSIPFLLVLFLFGWLSRHRSSPVDCSNLF